MHQVAYNCKNEKLENSLQMVVKGRSNYKKRKLHV